MTWFQKMMFKLNVKCLSSNTFRFSEPRVILWDVFDLLEGTNVCRKFHLGFNCVIYSCPMIWSANSVILHSQSYESLKLVFVWMKAQRGGFFSAVYSTVQQNWNTELFSFPIVDNGYLSDIEFHYFCNNISLYRRFLYSSISYKRKKYQK